MNAFGDSINSDGPSFNPGRRRKFEEFAQGEQVQVDRTTRALYAPIPVSIKRSTLNRFTMPNDVPTHVEIPQEPNVQRPDGERPPTWARAVVQTSAVGTVVIAVLSAHAYRLVLDQSTRAGRLAYATREHTTQTCKAAVRSNCNSAKRRLVTITRNLAPITRYRRRLPPSSPSSSSSSPRPRYVSQRSSPPKMTDLEEAHAEKDDGYDSDGSYMSYMTSQENWDEGIDEEDLDMKLVEEQRRLKLAMSAYSFKKPLTACTALEQLRGVYGKSIKPVRGIKISPPDSFKTRPLHSHVEESGRESAGMTAGSPPAEADRPAGSRSSHRREILMTPRRIQPLRKCRKG
ncbi:hypothetical protein MMC22_008896 [Lobaria immixta]|nr:hypothetical protein [Lobaria immixta]